GKAGKAEGERDGCDCLAHGSLDLGEGGDTARRCAADCSRLVDGKSPIEADGGRISAKAQVKHVCYLPGIPARLIGSCSTAGLLARGYLSITCLPATSAVAWPLARKKPCRPFP